MRKGGLFIPFFISAITFGLGLAGAESWNCAFASTICRGNPMMFEFPYAIFLLLGLFIVGLIANAPLIIACLALRPSIPANRKKLLLVAALGPTGLYFLLTLVARPLSQVSQDEWRVLLAISCLGLIAGAALLWAYSRLSSNLAVKVDA
jgi:hypothetical protein